MMRIETTYVIVQVSAGSAEQAKQIARTVVERKLAACAHIFPISSCYEWQGTIHEEDEHLILMKTRQDVYEKIEATIREVHAYDVPEILAVPILMGSLPYFQWIDSIVCPNI